ncbi:MAG: hypothetical protein HYR51_10370 [Candidatus Rokubacteria bacterium]|nr:hypothetical protein [Candidatus Rokubacteria bacterium]
MLTHEEPIHSKTEKIAPLCVVCGARIPAGPRMRIGLASVHLDGMGGLPGARPQARARARAQA